jgi:hypothetical protein
MEHDRHAENFDPFAAMYNVTPTNTDWIAGPTTTATLPSKC